MLFDKKRGKDYQRHKDITQDKKELTLAECHMDPCCYAKRIENMKARKNVGRSINVVKMIDQRHKDVLALRNLCAKLQSIRIDKRDDDEQSHAGHEHVRGLTRSVPALDPDGYHAYEKIRKPENVWNYKCLNDRDHIIQRSVDDIEASGRLKSLDPEEQRHIDDHIYGHRKQCHDHISDLGLKAGCTNVLQIKSPYKKAGISGLTVPKTPAYYTPWKENGSNKFI